MWVAGKVDVTVEFRDLGRPTTDVLMEQLSVEVKYAKPFTCESFSGQIAASASCPHPVEPDDHPRNDQRADGKRAALRDAQPRVSSPTPSGQPSVKCVFAASGGGSRASVEMTPLLRFKYG